MDISLNGKWGFVIDPENHGIDQQWHSVEWISRHIDNSPKIEVPSNFNLQPGLDRYIGVVWYFLRLPEVPYRPKSHEYSIEFEGSNYITEVWLNNFKLGCHEGGYLPFRMQFSPRLLSLKGENYVAVRVDAGLYPKSIPGEIFDGFQWGGIHRQVQLLVLERTRVRNIKIKTGLLMPDFSQAFIEIDFDIRNPQEFLDKCYAAQVIPEITYELFYLGQHFNGEAQFNPLLIQTGTQEIRLESLTRLPRVGHDRHSLRDYFTDMGNQSEVIEERVDLETYYTTASDPAVQDSPNEETKLTQNEKQQGENVALADLTNNISIRVNNPALWNPESPELYSLKLRLHGIDQDKFVRFGIRKIETIRTGIFLNDRGLRLQGINYYEENIAHGRYYPLQDRRKDLLKIKALGFNAIRLPRHSHDQRLMDLADEEGMLVVEEIPFGRHISAKNKHIWHQYARQISTLLLRDYNHPSVIMWVLGQEISTDRLDHRRLIIQMIDYARTIDQSRLITYGCRYCLHDTLRSSLPINLVHTSSGDTGNPPIHMGLILDAMYATHPQTPWIIGQFGKRSTHDAPDTASDSEQNQAQYIAHHIQLFNSKPYIAGWFLNSYRDYRSGIFSRKKDGGFNRSGVYDEFDDPKLIVKYLPSLLLSRVVSMPVSRFLAPLVRPFLSIIYGKLFCRNRKFTSFWRKKKVREFYSESLQNQ